MEKEGRVIKPKKKLMALSINEELGDVATHFMKSGSSFRPKKDLEVLNKFKHRLIPDSYRELPFEYDVMFNTNEVKTIRAWLYTDFLGKGIYVKVNSVKINDKLFKDIVNSDIKIDEERIEKIIANLQNKYSLQWNTEFHEKVIFRLEVMRDSNIILVTNIAQNKEVKIPIIKVVACSLNFTSL